MAKPPVVSEKVRKQIEKANNLARGKSVIGGTKFVDRKWKGKVEAAPQQQGQVQQREEQVKGVEGVWDGGGDGEVEELTLRLDTGLSMDRLHSTSEWLFPSQRWPSLLPRLETLI